MLFFGQHDGHLRYGTKPKPGIYVLVRFMARVKRLSILNLGFCAPQFEAKKGHGLKEYDGDEVTYARPSGSRWAHD